MSSDRHPPPSSSSSSASSSTPSSSTSSPPPTAPSSTATAPGHPLLPPLPGNPKPPGLLAAEIDPYALYHAQHARQAQPSPIPEKCLTFCSQRADAPPLCRMFCLRKRQLLNTQAEDLARLRPPPIRHTNPTSHESHTNHTSHSEAAETDRVDTSRTHSPKTTTGGSWWSPFEALRRGLDPYSFIYVRGTPDGVVGRYMEEVEYDDGQYDFGSISRGASNLAKRRREENRWEWLDWGDHGSLLYLPLTSLFHPILAIPENLSRIVTPSYTFLTRYYNSFTDGSQLHAWESFKKEVHEGGAVKLVQRMAEHNRKKAMEKREEIRKIQSQEKDRLEKMKKMHKGFDEKEVDER